jgi:kexin
LQFAGGSYDFNSHTALPEPRLSDDQHGTRCAGEIAAIKNDVCGVGVAYEAHVSGVRILSGPIADVDEAAALNYAYQENHIYSCSWGPPDDGKSMDAPKGLIAKAILNGAQNGRGGKGSIFVFAGGNGGASDDQCNFDGYTNSIYSMTISAVDREGLHPYYSEMCAANIATGWSSGSGDHIHTTDVAWNGVNRCTSSHGGTSAAAPLVAGVVALAVEARPDLTWRDVQHIAVHSAVMINPEDPDWQKTQAGRHFNHKFGYGVIDAHQFVEEAKRHKLVKAQAWMTGKNVTIPKDETLLTEGGVKSTFTITAEMLSEANLESVEHVTVRVWITHERRGDCNIELTSPHGTKSVLARPRRYDDATTGFPGWGFMTLKHWDESPIGEWYMEVFDKAHPQKTGNFLAWSMTLWGQAIDSSKAIAWNFPSDSIEFHETLAAAPATTKPYVPPATSNGAAVSQLPKPTEHLPSDHGTAPGESHQDFTNGTSTVATPEADTGYLNGFKSTWLFAASGIVVIFAASLAAFFVIRNRRKQKEKGDAGAYEFVPGEDDDPNTMSMSALERGRRKLQGGKSRRGTRTKELYDAFGEGSSQEDADDLDERAALTRRYKDEPDDGTDGRFAIDDDPQEQQATPRQGSRTNNEDELLFDASKEEEEEEGEGGSGGSGESGSWQDVKETR